MPTTTETVAQSNLNNSSPEPTAINNINNKTNNMSQDNSNTQSNNNQSTATSTASASTSSSSAVIPADASKSSSGVHSFMVNACKFVVDTKYSPLKPLGRGAYGVVCSALDKQSNRKVAIKKIPKAFEDLIDAKRILREVKLLRHFRHENVIALRDLVGPLEDELFEDIYIILDFMETDLHKIIYSKNELTDEHIQYFIYQLLKGLKYIHSAGVIHRDLKPSNLLLNGNCDLKICDFGLARGTKEDADYELTEYVVTRWYRAPEVMCSCQEYDFKIDVWSVGCIMAELHGRKPLFPGDDYIKQMNLIFNVLGTPSKDDMKFITNEKALEYIKSLKKKAAIPFKQIYKDANPLALDLMEKMLIFNPAKRISVDEALAHPYLKSLHNPKTESDCKKQFDFEFEKTANTKENIQQFMWDEIVNFRPEMKGKTWKRDNANIKASASNSTH
jgi:mitogen-activated protein kinase 1/3